MTDFHRAPSGELEPRRFRTGGKSNSNNKNGNPPRPFHKSALVRKVSSPMVPNEQCRANLGKVHYQLAVLHGRNRFPEVVPKDMGHENGDDDGDGDDDNLPEHDAPSVLFHLSHAASLMNAPACLALARVLSGRTTSVSSLLPSIVPVDFDLAKDLLERAMMTPTLLKHAPASSRTSVAPKVAAGCLLVTLLLEERQHHRQLILPEDPSEDPEEPSGQRPAPPNDHYFRRVLAETIDLHDLYRDEQRQLDAHRRRVKDRSSGRSASSEPFRAGDRVEANYATEGTYYPAVVTRVSSSSPSTPEEGPAGSADAADVDAIVVTVQYDDDGSSEDLPVRHVRRSVPPTATQSRTGGPLTLVGGGGSCDPFQDGFEDDADCELALRGCQVRALLARSLERDDPTAAIELYEAAASEAVAVDDGALVKRASEWSLRACELSGD
jgi:elongation factor 2 kinase